LALYKLADNDDDNGFSHVLHECLSKNFKKN